MNMKAFKRGYLLAWAVAALAVVSLLAPPTYADIYIGRLKKTVVSDFSLTELRNADGTVTDATGADTKFKIVQGTGFGGTPALVLKTNDANNTTITADGSFLVQLGADYEPKGAVKILVTCKRDGGTTWASTTDVDLEVYELTAAGAVGSDLCATASQDITGTSGAKTFTITSTGLTAGDRLIVYLRAVMAETGSTAGRGEISRIQVSQVTRQAR